MRVSKVILFLVSTCIYTAIAVDKVTYKVISLVSDNEIMGVIVDNQVYPLSSSKSPSNLLYTGKAPAPTHGYKYAILHNHKDYTIVKQENFVRSSFTSSSTPNEFYGRAKNSHTLNQLPTILKPLPIVSRIESKLHIDGEISTIHFIGDQAKLDNMHRFQYSSIDVPLDMVYISPNEVLTFKNVSLSLAGHSTLFLSKVSYKFKTPKHQDLYGYRRFKLRSMNMDATYMKEDLAYGIAKSCGIPTTERSYTRVFMNDKPVGFFGLVEQFKNPWVRNEFNNGKKFDQGTLFVADITFSKNLTAILLQNSSAEAHAEVTGKKHHTQTTTATVPVHTMHLRKAKASKSDLSYLGNNITLYKLGQYEVKARPSVGKPSFAKIMDLSKFILEQSTASTTSSSTSLWEQRMDVESFLRTIAFEIAISNSDGYLALGNNYMLYEDLENDRFVFGSQDFDLTMGITYFNRTQMNGGNYTEFPGFSIRPLTRALMKVPEYKQRFEQLLVRITKDLVNPKILGARIDDLFEMIKDDVAWDKKCPRLASEFVSDPISGKSMTSAFGSDFEAAVYGPITSPFKMALNEWLAYRSKSSLRFFNEVN